MRIKLYADLEATTLFWLPFSGCLINQVSDALITYLGPSRNYVNKVNNQHDFQLVENVTKIWMYGKMRAKWHENSNNLIKFGEKACGV